MTPQPPRGSQATRTNLEAARVFAPGTLLAGRYRIERLMGIGGMGMVYRARDEKLELTVALKVLRPEWDDQPEVRERFRRELILARQVSHRNVVRIHDLGQHDLGPEASGQQGELWFLTMDFVEGRSLKEVLEAGPLDVDTALDVLRQLAEGLAAAHEEGVVHRDLKPANVLMDDHGRAYLSDFGLARSLGASGITRTGMVVGTLAYLSPEQARGEAVDHRADLYTLGLIAFEMLTGHLPFPEGTLAEVLASRLSGTPSTLAQAGVEVPAFLQGVIRRCLERDPEQRYQSATEICLDLATQEATPSPGGPAGASAWGGRGKGREARARGGILPDRRRQALLVVAVIAVVAAVMLAFALLPRKGPEPSPAAAGPEPPRHAVAVLPLVDETGREDLAWTSRGLAEMVADTLAESPQLRVVDSARVQRTLDDLRLAARSVGPSELRLLAELLEVDRVVAGNVRAVAEQVRVDLRLIAVDTPDLTEERFDAEAVPEGTFTLVDELGAELFRRLEVAVPAATSGSAAFLATSWPALAAYGRGVERLLAEDRLGALEPFEVSVAEDPDLAPAWVKLAGVYHDLGYEEKALAAAQRGTQLLAAIEAGAGNGSGSRLSYLARARAASLGGDPGHARELLTELVERYPHSVEERMALAESYGDEGRLPEAEKILREVVRQDPFHPRGWYRLGVYAILQGKNREASDEYLVHALVIQNRLKNDKGRSDALNAMGAALEGLGELDRAVERYREAAELRRSIGDRGGYASTLSNLASTYAAQGDYEAARESLVQALAIRREIGDRSGTANLENAFGGLEDQQGNYRGALEHYRQALRLRQELGDQRAVAESHYNVGFSYYLLGEYDNADLHWRQALDLYRAGGIREGEAITRQGMGLLQLDRGEWAAATRSFLESLEVSRDIGLKEAEAIAQGNLGRAAEAQGRYDAALGYYREAAALCDEISAPRGQAEFRLLEAAVLLRVGLPDDAASTLEGAQASLDRGGNREQKARMLRLRGECELALGRPREGLELLHRAAEEAKASGSVVEQLWSRLRLAQAEPALAELEAVTAAAERLGHARLRLESGLALGRARLAAGQADAAESRLRETLHLARSLEPCAEAWRLHLALAQLLERQGAGAEASEQMRQAARQVDLLRSNLDERERAAFDRLPEVRAIVQTHDENADA